MARLDDNLLISRQKVINYLGLSNNFDSKKLGLYILNAQHEWILTELGQPLYDKLIADNQANTDTEPGTAFPAPYDNLVDNFVHPVMRWAVYIEIVQGSYLTVAENSVVQVTQAPSTVAAQKADIEGKIEMAESKLSVSLERLKQHLDASGSSIYSELGQSADLLIDERDTSSENFGPGFWASEKNFTNNDDSGSYYDNTEY